MADFSLFRAVAPAVETTIKPTYTMTATATSTVAPATTTQEQEAQYICDRWEAAGYASYADCYRANPTGEFAPVVSLAPMTSQQTATATPAPAPTESETMTAAVAEMETRDVMMEPSTPPTRMPAPEEPMPAPTPAPAPAPVPTTAPPPPPPSPVYTMAPAPTGGESGGGGFVDQAEEQLNEWVETAKASETCWLCWVVLGVSALIGAGVTYQVRK